MPFRLDENRRRIQFVTSARMPSLVYEAAVATGIGSNTGYINQALCRALAEDLGLDLETLLDELPEPISNSRVLFGGDRRPKSTRQHETAPDGMNNV